MSFRDLAPADRAFADTMRETETRLTNLELDLTAPPPGIAVLDGGITPPIGWLKADGSAISRTQYAGLFNRYGTLHGAGDGTTTFNLPNPAAYGGLGWIVKT